MVRHLISVCDLGREDLEWITARSAALFDAELPEATLRRRMVGTWFHKTSTRTRTSFTVAAHKLGAGVISYGPHDLQTETGESIADTALVLAQFLDALVIRTAGPPDEFRRMAAAGGPAIVNAMSMDEHPTQALSDFALLQRRFGRLEGLRVLYVGEGNNTAAALALLTSRLPGIELTLLTPEGFGLTPTIVEACRQGTETGGGRVVELHSPRPPGPADVVYTTRWQTTGTIKEDHRWRERFAPFRITQGWLAELPGGSRPLFMHDLPAVRGEEVDTDVLEGPASVVFEQSRQKLFTAMAVLEWCLGVDRAGARSPDPGG